jgi:hypothetical protein
MKMKVDAIFVFMFVLGLVTTAQAQTGKITFYRTDEANWRKITIVCDGKEVTKLPKRSRFTISVSAETHQCSDKEDPKRGSQPLVFSVERNKETFIRVEWIENPSPLHGPKPRLILHKDGWYPDPNDAVWREIRILK